ncbi:MULTISPECIES: TetR-like C-terminal domain-containing protein [Exiguobacterium]|uniref:TetR-like C-terminal domain-containing protein n=1 Tax=Exiguobacterium TaxID=33986 RepID=UPI00047D5191|nr:MULTISPECIES: TetR-like C-terminal domain-containing protein [Exiguobacterium]MCT4779184.1 TetR family transcriptional regulator C-terminal domain-containing protein [Exiguobacterium soli]
MSHTSSASVQKSRAVEFRIGQTVDRDLLLNYVIGGQLGLLISWLRNDRPYSASYMADQLSRMIVFGTVESIGFPNQEEDGI